MANRAHTPTWRHIPLNNQPKKEAGALYWMRGSGFLSAIGGAVSLVSSDWFIVSTIFLYAGLSILFADLFFEENLSRGWKGLFGALILATALFLCAEVTLKAAPLDISATGPNSDYPDGAKIAGINWKSVFTEVSVSINNRSGADYEDYRAFIVSDQPIVTVSQKTNVPGCTIQQADKSFPSLGMATRELPHKPVEFLATTSGFLVQCQKLPAHITMDLEIVLALVDDSEELVKKRLSLQPEDNAVIKMTLSPTNTSWWGHPEGNVYQQCPPPTGVSVVSNYKATFKPHHKVHNLPLQSAPPLNWPASTG